MAFKVTNAMVDVINKTANVVIQDQGPPNRMVQAQFPFDPPSAEGAEKDKVLEAAKKVLQDALASL
ncbi:MAG TPA: hypothetical protein VIJ04_07400 [Xanthobacteraceae bacterium]